MFNCKSEWKKEIKKRNTAVGGRGGPSWLKTPPDPVLSLPSLQGSEQLGDYNHRGNAAGQADKRGLRAGLVAGGGCPSVSLLALCQNNTVQRPTGARDSRFTSFSVVKYDGEVK